VPKIQIFVKAVMGILMSKPLSTVSDILNWFIHKIDRLIKLLITTRFSAYIDIFDRLDFKFKKIQFFKSNCQKIRGLARA
jgi:hypothetical protein